MYISGMNYWLGRSCLEIYFAGCKPPHCSGCHNKELQTFVQKDNVNEYKEKIKSRIETGMIEEVWLLGGEPLDQDLNKLKDLAIFIKDFGVKIFIWTKYKNFYDRINFLHLIDYVKCGHYDENLPEYYDKKYDILLASNNQKIVKITPELLKDY